MKYKFVDICAGIGGFHQVMTRHGGECVFASEVDPIPASVYKKNYGIDALNDISKVKVEDIPKHDVLCAGFPCVAFSKAGNRLGFDDDRGQIFFYIAKILEYHKPKYLVLENVKNLVSHDSGNTWRVICSILKEIGYGITETPILCNPIQLGIPHNRERVVILGVYGESALKIENDLPKNRCKNIFEDFEFDKDVDKKYYISKQEETSINMWDEFIRGIKEKYISFPVFGEYLKEMTDAEKEKVVKWKQPFIPKIENLYLNNKEFIDEWLKKYKYFENVLHSHSILEWQAKTDINNIWDGVLQFRPSGIRVKRVESFPTIVSMNYTQIPIIGPLHRRLTPNEVRKLQGFSDDFKYDNVDKYAYKQFGNAINVDIIDYFVAKLFKEYG